MYSAVIHHLKCNIRRAWIVTVATLLLMPPAYVCWVNRWSGQHQFIMYHRGEEIAHGSFHIPFEFIPDAELWDSYWVTDRDGTVHFPLFIEKIGEHELKWHLQERLSMWLTKDVHDSTIWAISGTYLTFTYDLQTQSGTWEMGEGALKGGMRGLPPRQ